MKNNPKTMNDIKRIFNNDAEWNGRVKIVQKPINFYTEDLIPPFFRSSFLNFNYIDTAYGEQFLSTFSSISTPTYYYRETNSYSTYYSGSWSNNSTYINPFISYKVDTNLLCRIADGFEDICRLILNSSFELFKTNSSTITEAIANSGGGCVTLFYIYVNLLANGNKNLVIDNAELSLHYLSIRQLKKFIETNFDCKVIFLMNRYDLFNQESEIENLYLLKNSGEIKSALDHEDDLCENKNLIHCVDLQKCLIDGKFGDEWKVKI